MTRKASFRLTTVLLLAGAAYLSFYFYLHAADVFEVSYSVASGDHELTNGRVRLAGEVDLLPSPALTAAETGRFLAEAKNESQENRKWALLYYPVIKIHELFL